jgi:hypothetical protein
MKNWIAAAVGLMLAASPLAFAQDKAKADEKKAAPAATAPKAEEKKAAAKEATKKEPTEKQKQQQARMKDCNEKAGKKDMKGDDRKKYMSACLKGEDPDKKMAQQEK